MSRVAPVASGGVRVGAGAAGGVQEAGVGPDLGPRLAQEPLGGQAVERLEEAVGAAAGAAQGLQLGVLGADPGDQDLVDVRVGDCVQQAAVPGRDAEYRTRREDGRMEILVTGAGGFVGGALVPELVGRGHEVRAATRHPERYRGPGEATRFDLDDEASLAPALDGVEVAYYLVHSMAEKGGFARRDLHHARTFGRAARGAGVDRVVYLSGLGDEQEGLSEHLASRRAVEDALASTGPELTVLRAAIVLGRGGASFEMLVQLVRRLPVMLCPRWVETASQPIALADAVAYLADAAETEATRGQRLEIGGPEVLTYRQMMERFARLEGRRRLIVSVPLFTPGLSSHWIGLVTDVPAAVARPLAEGLRNRVVVRNGAARRLMPRDLTSFEEACHMALGGPGAQVAEGDSPRSPGP